MKVKVVVWVLVAAAGSVVAGGCDKVKAPGAARLDLLPAQQYPQVALEGGLDEYLRFHDPIVTPSTAERPMLVTVPVRSLEDEYSLNVQYRFEFYDNARRPLRSNQGWQFKNLSPRVQAVLEANALETEAADWRLIVRPAR